MPVVEELDVIALGPKVAHRLRVVDDAVAAVALVAFVVLAFVVGFPTNPEGEGLGAAIQVPGQVAMLVVVGMGWLTSLKWTGVGAVVMAFGGVGLGLLASVEYPPWVAVGVMALFATPAVLVWLTWQHRRSHGEVFGMALVTVVVLGGEVLGSSAIYEHYFGPAHPVSKTAALPVDLVESVWLGDLRADGVAVVVRTVGGTRGRRASLVVREEGSQPAAATSPAVAVDGDRLARLRIEGLRPSTRYEYAVAVDGRSDRSRGRGSFTTAPPEGAPSSFTFAVASCARTGSNGAVYDAIREVDPLLYLITGDLHYANLEATTPQPFIDAISRALTAPAQAALYRQVPVDYVWDDHDYGPNDADASSPGRDAARSAFRAAVPHPPLAAGPAAGAIYHAFTIGRIRFVVTDTRSERTATSLLGDEQERWLLDELGRASSYGAVVWVSPDPWIAPAAVGRDDWGGFPEQRRRIADAVADLGVTNLVMVAGDAHMVALDDGSNSDYSTDRRGAGFPVLHAGALDRPGSLKGGPYSEGAFPGAGQFGVVRFDDDGQRVQVTLEGRTWSDRSLVRHTFELVPPT